MSEDEGKLFAAHEKIEATPYASLSPAQIIFKLIWELEAEVNNGGFQQYCHNSSGSDAPKVELALRAIGAEKCADIVANALELVGGAGLDWTNDKIRQSHMLAMTPNVKGGLDELDQQFYGYPDPLSDLLGKFVIDHPKEF